MPTDDWAVQVTKRDGVATLASPEAIESLRIEFERTWCAKLPGFFERELLAWTRAKLAQASFRERIDPGIARENALPKGDVTLGVLIFLMNDRGLFDFVRAVTGCGEIGCYEGRIYRMTPDPRHFDSWHDDRDGKRMVGVSVNLGEGTDGGDFSIRRKRGRDVHRQVQNRVPGDAFLFRIGEDIEHCISPVVGAMPKLALAGWFCSEPRFEDLLMRGR